MSKRKIWREGDEYVCSIGYRWNINEPEPIVYNNDIIKHDKSVKHANKILKILREILS